MREEQLKARVLAGQYLSVPAQRRDVLRQLCGLQAQYESNAFHALRIRCAQEADAAAWGGGACKTWTLRGTLHVVDNADIPLYAALVKRS